MLVRVMSAKSKFWSPRIGHILPAVFWFVLLALVLAETLIMSVSNPQTTSASSGQDDDLSTMWLDGPGSSNGGANAPAVKPPQKL